MFILYKWPIHSEAQVAKKPAKNAKLPAKGELLKGTKTMTSYGTIRPSPILMLDRSSSLAVTKFILCPRLFLGHNDGEHQLPVSTRQWGQLASWVGFNQFMCTYHAHLGPSIMWYHVQLVSAGLCQSSLLLRWLSQSAERSWWHPWEVCHPPAWWVANRPMTQSQTP